MHNGTPTHEMRCRSHDAGNGSHVQGMVIACVAGEGALLMLVLNGARVVVVGLGDTGLSLARWLQRQGAVVSVTDTRAAPPQAAVLRREFPGMALFLGIPLAWIVVRVPLRRLRDAAYRLSVMSSCLRRRFPGARMRHRLLRLPDRTARAR
jgi:hypothetical protein